MARKTPSRIQLRKEAEAAEAEKKTAGSETKKKKATRKKATTTRRAKAKVPERKRLVWGVFSASMKEEGRFPYDQRDAAEQKAEQLRSRSKKPFFIQPIKEPIVEVEAAADGEEEKKTAKKTKTKTKT